MISNYLKLAWRNLIKNKGNSIINIVGLSIGIACCLLISLWIIDEFSYDDWNSKSDRIYRVAAEVNFGGSHQNLAVAPAPLSAAMVADFPEVQSAVRFRDRGSFLVKRKAQNYKEDDIIFVDSTLFDVFDIRLVEGTEEALSAPYTLIISETMADKYFPGESPLGQSLTFDDNQMYKVNGVFADMPHNSHFRYDFFASLTSLKEASNGIWLSFNFPTYFVLQEDSNPTDFEAKLFSHVLKKYIAPQIEVAMGKTYDELAASGAFIRYYLQPLKSIHLHSDNVAELGSNGSIQYVWIFLSAALFILIIACVNFMNLSTAQSSMRAKEIGVRKVMGSHRSNLIGQFLSESVLMTMMALFIGIVLAHLFMPYYNQLAAKDLQVPFGSWIFWMFALGSSVLLGILAGTYPAFFLSSFKPIDTLSGRSSGSKGNLSLRNVLVTFQFLIAVVLIIGTLCIQKQMTYVQNKKMGFDREQVLILNDAYALANNRRSFKEAILRNPEISNASYSGFLPVPSSRSDSPLCTSTEIRDDQCVSMQIWNIDEDYIETLGMTMADGRNFNPQMATDSQAVIINRTAAKLFGFDNPVDEYIYGDDGFDANNQLEMNPLKIIGVVEDFHFESLRQNIRALCFRLSPSSGSMSIKLAGGNVSKTINTIEKTWNEMAPGQPFSYQFMDESFDRMYATEVRVGQIFRIFSGLGIVIACLGLFGLAAFTTERRTREIGIRKVLGASTTGIIRLLSRDFIRLVLLALLLAMPLAWFMMDEWLSNFAYRVNLDIWLFILAGMIALLVAFVTVSFHSIKAALANPVESLRSE